MAISRFGSVQLDAVRAVRDPEVKQHHKWGADTIRRRRDYDQDALAIIERDFVPFRTAMPRTVFVRLHATWISGGSWTHSGGTRVTANPTIIGYNEDEQRYMGWKSVYDGPRLEMVMRTGADYISTYTDVVWVSSTVEFLHPFNAGLWGIGLDFVTAPSNMEIDMEWNITSYPLNGQQGTLGELLREEDVSYYGDYDVNHRGKVVEF